MTVKQSRKKASENRIPLRIIIPPNLDTASELQLRHDIEEMYNNSENRYHITYEQEVKNVDDLLGMTDFKESAREMYKAGAKMGKKKK